MAYPEAELHDRLDQKVKSDSLTRIAESITDWPGVAKKLPGIKDQDVAAIKDKQPCNLHK